MKLHASSDDVYSRLKVELDHLSSFEGEVFRFINPRFSKAADQFSGMGSLHSSGRWMAQGEQLAAYASLTPETALAEALAANRYYGFPDSQSAPMLLVTAQIELTTMLDLTDANIREKLDFSLEELTESDWRRDNGQKQESLTQALGRVAYEFCDGLLVPSAAFPTAKNLVIFPQNLTNLLGINILNQIKWPE